MAGLAVVLLTLYPLWNHPRTLHIMYRVLVYLRSFNDATSSFWKFMDYWLLPYYTEKYWLFWSRVTNIIMLVYIIILLCQMLRSRTRSALQLGFVMYGLFYYIFGYGVHAKHVTYVYLGMLFIIDTHFHYLIHMNLLLCMTMFSQSCRLGNENLVLHHSVAYILLTLLFDLQSEQSSDSFALHRTDSKEVQPSSLQSACSTALDLLVRYRRVLLVVQMIVTLGYFSIYHYAVFNYNFTCQNDNHRYTEDVAFRTCFLILLVPCLYWCLAQIQHSS